MKKPIKRILAKEIIIFFSSVVIVGLVCLVFLSINELRMNKSQKLRSEISLLSSSSDSISNLFPKAISFEKMIVGDLPEQYKKSHKWDKYIVSIDSTRITEVYINNLYDLLLALEYHFLPGSSGWMPKEIFYHNIVGELYLLKREQKTELNRIYKFLTDRRYISASFEELDYNLLGLPLPPTEKLSTKFLNKN